ncbi:hypothetical protein RJT34_16655 [Clitoria ternatea]|uniref:CRC domain-containing protein n=1 Tax=Clitoria ternatea TaxID=43366 RepID=A0AAN9PD14_CLITE
MDSPEPSNHIPPSSSAAIVNAASNTPLSESPQESPFVRFANTLPPITPAKAFHGTQSFLGLNSPPLVFKSPRICHREMQFVERPHGTQSFNGGIYQSENGGDSLGEVPEDSKKSKSQQPFPEMFVTDSQDIFGSKNDANTQNSSPPQSIDDYFADPCDIDKMFSANQDVEQSTDAGESSLGDLTRSENNILEFDRKDDSGDKAEKSLPFQKESNVVLIEKLAYEEEPEKIEGEKNGVKCAPQEHTKLDSSLAVDIFEEQYSYDSLPQDVKRREGCNEMVSTSHVAAENILQNGSEASLKYHGFRRRCLQFGEAGSSASGSNKSHMKLYTTSSGMQMVKLSEPITSLIPQRVGGNFPVTGPKPSGIGLHLNSIINAMPTGYAGTTGMRLSDGLQGMKSTSSISLHKVGNMKRSILSSNSDGQSLLDNRNESREIDASIAADSSLPQSPGMTEPISSYPATVKRKLGPADAENSEELNQSSPCKKKKKTSNTGDGDGCKRCHCKKSRCLKLYCECFAFGSYCTGPCSCQGCLNRPEYEERVSDTRKQIESRNPTAFAPKIVQSIATLDISSNTMEQRDLATPSSARHKRAPFFPQLMKKANVGCSSGCRCEGCKNVYGKKEDYVALEHARSKERVSSIIEKPSDRIFCDKLEMVPSKTQHLSPITASLPCFNHAPLEMNQMLGTTPYGSRVGYTNVNIMDQSSPTCESVSLLHQHTPLPNPQLGSGASSFPSRTNVWTDIPQSRPSRGCIRQLHGGSLRWRSSPVTPRTKVVGSQQCPESDDKHFDILEDETPDILKEASTPMKPVKVNSPTQKRVSPPQSHHKFGSSSSGALRSSRKFILKAVPSFPPLTPCVDSKGNDNQDLGDSGGK